MVISCYTGQSFFGALLFVLIFLEWKLSLKDRATAGMYSKQEKNNNRVDQILETCILWNTDFYFLFK